MTSKSEAARQLAAMRKTEQKKCPECGLVFTALERANSTCRKCKDRLRKQAKLPKDRVWLRKFYNGSFQHFFADEKIACYKDKDGWRFRFVGSVRCAKGEFSGYAKSIHYWKSLAAVKSHVEKTVHEGGILSMVVADNDNHEWIEGYTFKNNKFELDA
jgi:ribosomal protein L37AE/L43A